ncbi:MAG TPA: DUF805 domain-containing protein [Chryseolinea sp.]|nr:DUF805 domain-containing protein [Chryseolinea sp.]
MFKHPFSFDGRIRRTEYGLTFIIYLVAYFIIMALIATEAVAASIAAMIAIVPLVWFLWAQGAKRCHDIDRSGWMQLIPFYFFFLLFEDGKPGRNEFGTNPKQQGGEEVDVLESETLDGHLR